MKSPLIGAALLATAVSPLVMAAECPLTINPGNHLTLLVHPDEFTERWIDRAAQLGVSRLSMHPTGGKGAVESLTALLERLKTPEFRARIDAAKARGLEVGYEMHAASWLLPRSLFATHPDYFRMDAKGTRQADRNFCVSSPEAMELVAKRAVELAGQLYGSIPSYNFWLDDCKGGACQCPKCRTLSASDQQLLYCNRVATELRKSIPGAKFCYLAYFDAIHPPRAVKPAEGVFLEYAPFNRDMHKPLAEQDNPDVKPLRDLLKAFGSTDACVLEYWLDNSFFSKWKKPPKRFAPEKDVILSDLAWYRQLGFGRLSSFACFLGDDYERLWGEPDASDFARPKVSHELNGFDTTLGGKDATFFTCGLTDDAFVFRFEVKDATVCASPTFETKRVIDYTDRVELFFSPTPELKGAYYCAEIDPLGRIMDYQGRMYRKLDFGWRFKTMRTRAVRTADGYIVAGSVARQELTGLGIDPTHFGLGVFRADFDQRNQLVAWCSAAPMPDRAKPDFHQPVMFFDFATRRP